MFDCYGIFADMSNSQFNNRLYEHRRHQFGPGMAVYEPHTNLMFYPAATQPTASSWECLSGQRGRVLVEEKLETQPFIGKGLGAGIPDELQTEYGAWSDDVIDSLETEEEREAVRAQVQREREWRARGYM